jgi:hypothetical protein
MKLKFCSLVLILFFARTSFSQVVPEKWSLSLNAEFSFTSLRNAQSPFATIPYKVKPTTSIFYGVYAEYSMSSRFSFVTGLSRNERGGSASYNSQSTNDGFDYYDKSYRKISNQYWSVPLMGRFYFPVQKARVYAELGGYAALRVSGTVRSDDSETITQGLQSNSYSEYEATVDDKGHTNKYDVGIVGGGGASWPLTDKINFQVSLRMWYGLRQIDGMYNNQIIEGPSASNLANIQKLDYYNLSSFSKYLTVTASAGIVVKL